MAATSGRLSLAQRRRIAKSRLFPLEPGRAPRHNRSMRGPHWPFSRIFGYVPRRRGDRISLEPGPFYFLISLLWGPRGGVRHRRFMADAVKIAVEARDPAKNKGTGSRVSRRLRANGQIPAIIYGHKQDPLPISLARASVWEMIKSRPTSPS